MLIFFSFWSQRHIIPKRCRHSSLAVGLVWVSDRLEEILSKCSTLPTVVEATRAGLELRRLGDEWRGVTLIKGMKVTVMMQR